MSSGVQWNEDYEDVNSDVSRFNDAKPDAGIDATVSYMRKLPRAHPPGEVWHYNTGETNLVGDPHRFGDRQDAVGDTCRKRSGSQRGWRPRRPGSSARRVRRLPGAASRPRVRDFARFGLFVLANGNV
jgi:hypothetical protein